MTGTSSEFVCRCGSTHLGHDDLYPACTETRAHGHKDGRVVLLTRQSVIPKRIVQLYREESA